MLTGGCRGCVRRRVEDRHQTNEADTLAAQGPDQALILSAVADRFVAVTATALFAGLAATSVYWMDDLFYGVSVSTQWWTLYGLVIVIHQHAKAGLSERTFQAFTIPAVAGPLSTTSVTFVKDPSDHRGRESQTRA